MGIHLGMWGFIPSHSPTLSGAWALGLHFWLAPLQALALVTNSKLGLWHIPHPIVAHISWCECVHTIDDLGLHLLCCPCGNERILAHDTLWDINATITSKNGTHIQREVFHLFPHHTWRWVDLVITKDKFWTLADIIIVNPIRLNLV